MLNQLSTTIMHCTTTIEKKIFLCFLIQFAASAILFFGYPIWFQNPILICQTISANSIGEKFECPQEIACNGKYSFTIDYKKSPQSLSTDFNLICNRTNLQRKSLSIMLLSGFLGAFFNFLFSINKTIKKKFINFSMLGFGLSCLMAPLMAVFFPSIEIVSIFFGGFHFFYFLQYPHLLTIMKDNFSEDFAKISPALYNSSLGLFGIIHPLLAFIFKSNWKVLMVIVGFPVFISGIYLLTIEFGPDLILITPTESSIELNEINSISNFGETNPAENPSPLINAPRKVSLEEKEYYLKFNYKQYGNILSNNKVRKNFFCLAFCIALNINSSVGCTLELKTLAGSIFTNVIIAALLILIGAFSAGLLIMKYNGFKLTYWIYFSCGICLSFYLFLPRNIKQLNVFYAILATIPGEMFFILLELQWNLTFIILPQIIPFDTISVFFGFSYFIGKLISGFIPYVNFYIKIYIVYYPFVFYGGLFFIAFFILIFVIDKPAFDLKFYKNSLYLSSFGTFLSPLLISSSLVQQTISGDVDFTFNSNSPEFNNNDDYISILSK